METSQAEVVQYHLPLGENKLPLNPLVGKKIKITFDGEIRCLETDQKLKRTFGQGYSWEAFNTLARCDECIFKPELCHFAAGTCREPEWGEANCLQPHIVYLANTSDLKVGITRKSQVPTRWMDQGAVEALPILEVKDRLTSGLIEVEMAKRLGDKTNWRKMLKNEVEAIDLKARSIEVLEQFSDLIAKYNATVLDEKVHRFSYPVEAYPEKVTNLTLDKTPILESTLLGIKGQYLILEKGVINMRRHQGYVIAFEG